MTEPDQLILERALLGALAAMVPVPIVDDVLQRRARTTLFRELAARSGLRLDEASLRVLGADRKASFVRSAGLRLAARALRGATAPLRVAGRAKSALETFQLATLLHHYAARHHQGLDLDAERALALRRSFDEVIDETRLRLTDLRRPAEHAAALRARFDERWARGGR